ncbi:hypothetical protein EOZ52_23800 [Salmonella enterica subsp. enterica serovar Kentucky]|uniref:Uncharacterized protein n=1 Tax=Salmonella enterica subsp. enterica serovar Kentucky TaxID=192955 RepID=A0A5X5ZKJ2_SALET|nr:hypothetical protein [Salmonella enterica]EAA9476577.1 hypothetical protein [Salmonella enterica subsp. enterica serovar Kentucky]EAC1481701.1 hypothetical protein [Escherichia coli]EAO0250649.1 hypothetical protein [Salmonella enterica subsp. enterica]EBW0393987.1 hypothetical protein [Salmonella enterica subsp. enterica serovar Enteritidis]ECJ3845570.1 hypothetical protein [Salmonella enterica subsp. enterica serovar 4,12:d:-]ECT7251996.1 hypothetical protein [Salmonella enterica subsp. 
MKRGLRNGVAPYIPAPFAGMPGAQATARQRRRDRNGRCKPWFRVRDGSPPGRRQLRWLRSRQPAPPGGRPEKP